MKCTRRRTALFLTALCVMASMQFFLSDGGDEKTAVATGSVSEASLIAGPSRELETRQQMRRIRSSQVGEKKVLLFWGRAYGKAWKDWIREGTLECGGEHTCLLTTNRSRYPAADAVVFSAMTDSHSQADMPPTQDRPPSQRWIFHSVKPTYKNDYSTNQNLKSAFNWTHTFLHTSDVPIKFGTIRKGRSFQGFNKTKNYLKNRLRTAVTIINDCTFGRIHFIRRLRKYIDVEVLGKCGRKKCLEKKTCLKQLKFYKFYLALESNICTDYVSEKFYLSSLERQIVPVVLGRANYSDTQVAPPESYIDALQFRSVKHLAVTLRNIGRNRKLYSSYFQWHSRYAVETRPYFDTDKSYRTQTHFCDLCSALHDETRPPKQYPDIINWFSTETSCQLQPYLYKT